MSATVNLREVKGGNTSERNFGKAGMSAFERHISETLEHVEYRRCESGEDLEEIYRLRYDSYLAAGMIEPNASRMVRDDYDDLPNSYRYGVYYDGTLVSTVRFHHVTREMPHSPSMTVFGDVLRPRVEAGESFIDPSRFAADLEWSKSLRGLPYITLRLPLGATRYFNVTACLQAIKEDHAAFYKRVFIAEPLVKQRQYPGLICPVDLWQSPAPLVWQQAMERFAFFRMMPAEERMLYKQRGDGADPLTVLPTAKYLVEAA